MNDIGTIYLILLIVCLVLSAFFTSSEIAFFALQKVKLDHMMSENVKGSSLVSKLISRPDRLLSVILFGNNLVNTAATALATALAVSVWGDQGILFSTIGLTVIILIFAEITPKTVANAHAERFSLLFGRPIEILAWIFYPFVWGLSWIARGVTRILGGTTVPRSLVSQDEIRTMISVGHKDGTVEEGEARLLHKVFEFGNRPVREVMVPRTEVYWVEKGITLAAFLEIYAEHPISRFPVYEDNTDKVVGVLAVKDVLMALAKETMTEEDSINELIRPVFFTPESKYIDELFSEMRDKNYRLAAVVDEYGGIAGIASLSLLVEEIVGAVGDEFADAEKEFEEIDENTFQIDGGMNIEEANAEMELALPESEDYETVAGFILSLLGRIPRTGERLRFQGMVLTVTEMRGMKIEKVLLTRPKRVVTEPDAAS